MKPLSYLTVPAVSLALLVLGCGQVAPIAPTESAVVLPESAGHVIAPGNCCPEGFDLAFEVGNPADLNGDNQVCRMVTPGGAITIDNNAPGECPVDDCIPPDCGI